MRMNLTTKCNIHDVIAFHPFGDPEKKPIQGVVFGMTVKVDRKGAKQVVYDVMPRDKEPWEVREKSVLSIRRKK